MIPLDMLSKMKRNAYKITIPGVILARSINIPSSVWQSEFYFWARLRCVQQSCMLEQVLVYML